MAVLWVDGGGVFPDRELADDVRLRIRLTDNPAEDVTICVEDGLLHVLGQYAALGVERIQANHVAMHTVTPGGSLSTQEVTDGRSWPGSKAFGSAQAAEQES